MRPLMLISSLLLAACNSGEEAKMPFSNDTIDVAGLKVDASVDPKQVEAMGVPVPPNGKVYGASKFLGVTGIVIENKQTPADIEAWYKKALTAKGYTLGPVMDAEGSNMFEAKSAAVEMTIQFTGQDNGTKTETLILLDRKAVDQTANSDAKTKG